jgi:hypothetical protein
MNINCISLEKKKSKRYNFKKLLQSKDSLIWKNCSDLEIIINSKINKLILINCKSIKIIIGNTISGIDLENCENVKIYLIKNKNFGFLSCFKSKLFLFLHKNTSLKNIMINSENSKIYYKYI